MDEILRFVVLANSGRFTLTDLCEQFGISRKTSYKHLERYAAGGLKAVILRIAPLALHRKRAAAASRREMKKVLIHSDGGCHGNPGPGGWAAVLE